MSHILNLQQFNLLPFNWLTHASNPDHAQLFLQLSRTFTELTIQKTNTHYNWCFHRQSHTHHWFNIYKSSPNRSINNKTIRKVTDKRHKSDRKTRLPTFITCLQPVHSQSIRHSYIVHISAERYWSSIVAVQSVDVNSKGFQNV